MDQNATNSMPGDPREPAPVPTSTRRKLAIGAVIVLIAALLVWSFLAHRAEADHDEEGVRPAATSHVVNVGGEVAIVLDSAAAVRANLATAVLAPVRGAIAGTGARSVELRVPLQGELVADPARVTTIRAAVPGRLTSTSWPVLGERVGAGRVLGQVSDAKPLVAPREGTVTRVGAQPGELVQAGQELLQLTDLGALLARVVWRPDLIGPPPSEIHVAPVTGTSPGIRARLVGSAGDVDTLTRLPVYLYRLAGAWPGARPGLPVRATARDTRVATGAARADTLAAGAVIVPETAVVQWQALAWVYVERAPRRYVRVRVPTDRAVTGGYVVATAESGLAAGDRVVVRGAQQLLSEEFRTQLRTGEGKGESDEKK